MDTRVAGHAEVSLAKLLGGLKAAGEATRLRILALLDSGDLTVKDLTEILTQSQPRVSRHLKLLSEAGLISRFPEGAWVYYRLAREGEGGRIAHSILDCLDSKDAVLVRDRQRHEAVKIAHAEAAARYFRAMAENWDRLRSLHAPEDSVEATVRAVVGDKPVQALLDIGTGTGRMLELLGPLAARAVGVDTSHDMLSVARARLSEAGLDHVQVRHGDAYDLQVQANGFDLVLVHQVLHYLDDPARAIREAARTLAPGGRLLVVDFAPHDIEMLRESHAHRRLGFAHEEVADWCVAAGLEVVEIRDLSGEGADAQPLTVTFWLARDRRQLMA
ncbi:putative methyltransferase YcgJ [Hartmannibacter diazotrophicus]|uniref:Putative methyltransferase YcgJ n=1 Tax=Hartmannibacter diazotrophicus TaxID=1482074 RepID=A0A2C9DBM5_9HYPH|nr:metalloregulator ArsR/SmtB family transcription factor [Hartmannibacter diazotrophicus]SON57724.1 putative methyltransferase YcgJ [Hartmannibacter diazotrophicus]